MSDVQKRYSFLTGVDRPGPIILLTDRQIRTDLNSALG